MVFSIFLFWFFDFLTFSVFLFFSIFWIFLFFIYFFLSIFFIFDCLFWRFSWRTPGPIILTSSLPSPAPSVYTLKSATSRTRTPFFCRPRPVHRTFLGSLTRIDEEKNQRIAGYCSESRTIKSSLTRSNFDTKWAQRNRLSREKHTDRVQAQFVGRIVQSPDTVRRLFHVRHNLFSNRT